MARGGAHNGGDPGIAVRRQNSVTSFSAAPNWRVRSSSRTWCVMVCHGFENRRTRQARTLRVQQSAGIETGLSGQHERVAISGCRPSMLSSSLKVSAVPT